MNGRLNLRVVRPLKPVANSDMEGVDTWAKALKRTSDQSGLLNKSLACEMDMDPGQLSKMMSGQLGIMADDLFLLMDAAGTEFPLMWLNFQRGYDIEAMRQRETELQRQLRSEREARGKAEAELQTIKNFLREVKAA